MKQNLDEKLEKLEVIGLILRPETPSLKTYVLDFKRFMDNYGVKVLLTIPDAQMIDPSSEDIKGEDIASMCKKCDLIISLGGDGTLISAARRTFLYGKPILGVNMGNLGFLTDWKADEIKHTIERLFKFEYRIDMRMVMQIESKINGKVETHFAINDLVIRSKKAKMIHSKLFLDGEIANNYHGDALIISTPTGATGYNLSAGGPIVFPYAKNFIFTPICPHSFTQRPLVLPVHFDIKIVVDENDAIAIVDGQDEFDMNKYDEITIKMSEVGAKMIHRSERNFFEVIREKLNWGE
jgi:NAD+ kinase